MMCVLLYPENLLEIVHLLLHVHHAKVVEDKRDLILLPLEKHIGRQNSVSFCRSRILHQYHEMDWMKINISQTRNGSKNPYRNYMDPKHLSECSAPDIHPS